jgi:hypothetical protein
VTATLADETELWASDPATGAAPVGRVRQLMMGDIARAVGREVELAIRVTGSAPIERIDILDGLDHLETVRPYAAGDLGNRVRLVYTGAEYRGRARTTTWDGRLTVTGASIRQANLFNNWNLDRGLQSQDAQGVAWKAVTTGNYGGIDLWLDRVEGHLAFETKPCSGTVDLAALSADPMTFEAGGLERRIEVQRLPDALTERHIVLTRRVPRRAKGDTRLYVRIQQEDGHRMWSSPIYLIP